MSKMYIGPHQAADLRNTGRWNPNAMTTDKAEAEASNAVDNSTAEPAKAPMRAPVDSEIIVPAESKPCSATEALSPKLAPQLHAAPHDAKAARTSSAVALSV